MVREPLFRLTPLLELRPTQITVGMHEVAAKRRDWKTRHGDKAREFLARHMIPVVLGPHEHRYVIDHHHLARALHDEGLEEVATSVVLDLRRLDDDAFWVVLDNRGMMHPFDDKGRRRDYDKIPKRVVDLVDDPFRSLAGALRRQGGFAKDTTPFSEFLWADFLRRRLKRRDVEDHFDKMAEQALALAKSRDADYLPGWCGPVEE
jgi:hypothetical protein